MRVPLILGALALTATVALAQSDLADLLGHHPHHDGHDPYRDAVSINDFPCCHGRDCLEFLGEPEKVEGGWMFGPWFVAEKKAIKPQTLHRSVRGRYVICFQGGRAAAVALGAKANVYCGHAPESGV